MATVQQERQQRRRERKQLPFCPECGNRKAPTYVICTDCRAKKSHWQELPVRPRFPRRLPLPPLHARVEEWLLTNLRLDDWGQPRVEESISILGISVRRLYEWRSGNCMSVSVGIADQVLTVLGLDWLDVWTREEHPRFAACLDAIDALGDAPADGWCPVCCEPVASVNGTCPWHPVPVVVEPYLGSEAA